MDVVFDGVTVRVIVGHDVIHLQSPPYLGLKCTLEDLRQIYELMKWHASGTINLLDGTILECVLGYHVLELRQDGQIVVRVDASVKPDTRMNDLTGFHSFLSQATAHHDDDFELQPTYGYFLNLEEQRKDVKPAVAVLNLQLRRLGKLRQEDIALLRQIIEQDSVSLYLSDLLIQKDVDGIVISPDNREIDLPPGHRQIFNLEAPLELTTDAFRHLVDTAEFLMEFETRMDPMDEQ